MGWNAPPPPPPPPTDGRVAPAMPPPPPLAHDDTPSWPAVVAVAIGFVGSVIAIGVALAVLVRLL